jgi:hypothetical protein
MRRSPWAFAALNLLLICFHVNLFGGWNQLSRALPLLSFVEEGALHIDARHELTGDKALIGGHYYSEKAPATTLVSLPFYALLRAALWSSRYAEDGGSSYSSHALDDAVLVGTLVCSALPFLALLLLFVSRLEAVAGPDAVLSSRLVSVWLLYGTFVFVYADYFFGHMLAALLLLVAYRALLERDDPLVAGLALGGAFFTDYPSIVVLGVWGLQCLAVRRTRRALLLAAGALPGIAAALWYNASITGSPLTPAYKYVSLPEFESQTHAFGFGGPSPEAIWHLVFGEPRGLFFHAPVLLAFLIATPTAGLLSVKRWVASPVLALLAAYLLLFSSFYMWTGGSCYGPRFLLPVVVLLLYRAGQRLVAGPVLPRALLYVTGGLGLMMNLVVLNTTLHIPPTVGTPFSSFLIPYFVNGIGSDQTLGAHVLPLPLVGRLAVWGAAFALVLGWSRRPRPGTIPISDAAVSLASEA